MNFDTVVSNMSLWSDKEPDFNSKIKYSVHL